MEKNLRKLLNPALFDENRPEFEDSYSLDLSTGDFNRSWEKEISGVRAQMKSLEERQAKVMRHLTQYLKTSQVSMERTSKRVLDMEERLQEREGEFERGWEEVQRALVEKRQFEQKVAEMIERHQAVVHQLEARLQQAQKILKEKEELIHSTRSALHEAKLEIAKLKRL